MTKGAGVKLMRSDAERTFDAVDAENTRDFLLEVLHMPFLRAIDGSRVLIYSPGDIGVHPRALAAADRGALGPHGLALTCDDLPETTAELAAAGALLTSTGWTPRLHLKVTFRTTPEQSVDLVAARRTD
jgi:hypothetical protein